MENNEYEKGANMPEQNQRIQLIVNHTDEEDDTINLGNVFQNMKSKKKVFAWVLILCLMLGICAPLLLYQINEPMMTVSSVVTLRYYSPVKVLQKGNDDGKKDRWIVPADPEYAPVTDLSAPDGTELDLNQITSSYVLQKALNEMHLSKPITVGALRRNIKINKLLTEDSQRTKEALTGLAEAKDSETYMRLQEVEMKYQNRFVVLLENGFKEEEDDLFKTEIKEDELKQLLNLILSIYNDYLVQTYADINMPTEAFSMIDIETLDIQESVDQIRKGVQHLIDYCNTKTDTVKTYRSWQTGRNLEDWIETLETFKNNDLNYMFVKVNNNAVTKDKNALLANWRYTLQTAKSELKTVNEKIEETRKVLSNYKNDEVFISQQESDSAKTTKVATEYYNKLVLQQMESISKAATLSSTILNYEDRIQRLETMKENKETDIYNEELRQIYNTTQELYLRICSHMKELFESKLYTNYIDYSAALGEKQNFLVASAKKMLIGGAVGIVIACSFWFVASLLPEYARSRKEVATSKEATV